MTEAELSAIEARANEHATPCDVLALVREIRRMRSFRKYSSEQLWRFVGALRLTRSVENEKYANGIEYALNILNIEKPIDMEWKG